MKTQNITIYTIAVGFLVFLTSSALAQNFGVDVVSPQEKLDVNGAIRIGNTANSNAGSIRYSSVSHKFQVNINGTWYDLATSNNAVITNVSYNTTTNILTITEGSNNFTVDLTELQDNTDDQAISYNATTNVITLEDGGSIDLSDLQDDTDDQTLSEVYGQAGNTVTLTAANGDIRFIRGVNTEVLTLIEASGNVGIGTNNPTGKLSVVDISSGNGIDISESGSGDGVTINESGDGDGLTVLSTNAGNAATFRGGNVGIGTNVPLRTLHVDGSARVSGLASGVGGAVITSNSSGDLSFTNFPNDSRQILNGTGTWNDINTMLSGDYIENQTTTDQAGAFRISGNGLFNGGNVGIGTITPGALLNVYEPTEDVDKTTFTQAVNNSGILITTDYSNAAYTPGIFWNTQNENPTKPKAGIYLQTDMAGSKMILATSTNYITGITNDALVIDDNGNIGIGTLNPDQKLELNGGGIQINGDYGIGFNGSTPDNNNVGGDRARLYYDNNFFGSGSDAIVIEKTDINGVDPDGGIVFTNKGADNAREASLAIRGNGNVGIGSLNPAQRLDVVGDINTSSGFRISNSAPTGEYLRGDGTRYVSSTIPYSDITGVPTSLPPTGAAGGDLTGTYPNPTITANAVGSAEIANNAVGSSEIIDNAVTNADMADMAANTVKGNPTSSSADPSDIAISTNSALGRLGGNIVSIPMGTASNTIAWGDHTHAQLHNRSHAMTSTSDHTATAWRMFYSNASGQVTEIGLGTSGQVLKSNGSSASPTWQTDNNTGNITGTGANGRATFWTGTSTQSSNGNFLWDNTNLRLGIGTTTAAAARLSVYNAANAAETTFTTDVANAGMLVRSNYAAGSYTPGLFWSTIGNNDTKPKAGIYLQTNASGSKMMLATSNVYGTGITNSGMVIDQNANVGIGSASPAAKLTVEETYTSAFSEMARFVHNRSDISDSDEGSYISFKVADGNNGGAGFDHARISWRNNGTGADENEGELAFWTATDGTTSQKMLVSNTGNVGIATATPTEKLHVEGNLRLADGGYIDDDATPMGDNDDWIRLNGYIQMQPVSDDYGVQIKENDSGEFFGLTQKNGYSYLSDNSASGSYFLRGNGAQAYVRGDLIIEGDDLYSNSGPLRINAEDAMHFSIDYNNNDADNMYFSFNKNDEENGSADVELMRITETGRVGIGVSAPTQALDIAGQIKMSGGSPGLGKVLVSDATGVASWVTLNGSGYGDNLGNHTATANLNMGNREIDAINYLDIRAANGYGLRFWGSSSYKMSMGNATEYKYGTVTDYSIKTAMSSDAGRGWTWGINGSVPVAALDNTGNYTMAGDLNVVGADIKIANKHAFRGNDSWLRLNQDGAFSNGTYTPGLMRADGGYQVDGGTVIDAAGRYHYSYGTQVNKWGAVNTSGFGIDARNSGDWDLLVYEDLVYAPRLTLGYGYTNGYITTYDSNENLYIDPNGSGNIFLHPNSSGNVCIGTTTVSQKLTVAGRIKSTGINETSDIRLKKNIRPINSALQNVLALRGVTYDWRSDEFPDMGLVGGMQYGLIAQELEKVIPELVATDEEGWKSIDYSHLVPVLIEAIKEQNEIIDTQSAKIEGLEGQIEEIKAEKQDGQNQLDMILERLKVLEEGSELKSSVVNE